MSLEFNADMPTDVCLKGDGTIWVTVHGNEGIRWRPLGQHEVLEYMYKAINYSERLISI